MSVGLLFITHEGIGEALLRVAYNTFGNPLPLQTAVLSVLPTSDPALLMKQAKALLNSLDLGHGVIILTDMYGSTPSNIAHRLKQTHHAIEVIAGVNLPMILRLLNYATLPITALAAKAISGGKEGVYQPEPRLFTRAL